ncbi:MAG: hypothetical protein OEY29_06520 [Gammaproteobacteria bacterium]|nr:hypothetical protein [Gammaproteobacteria bacterium]
MKSIVTVSIHFSFKGERHTPSLTLEFDDHILLKADLTHLYQALARENNYDLYSYEYEMMQAEPLVFSDAKGLVADHIENGSLNFDTFKAAFHNSKALSELQNIAKSKLKIDDLQQHPDLMDALLEAYCLGQKQSAK